MSRYLSTRQAAHRWGVSPRTVERWAEQGRIKGAQQIGRGGHGVWIIPDEAGKPEVKRGRPKQEVK